MQLFFFSFFVWGGGGGGGIGVILLLGILKFILISWEMQLKFKLNVCNPISI